MSNIENRLKVIEFKIQDNENILMSSFGLRGWELTINSWFSNSKIRTMIFDRFKNRSPDFKLFIKLVANRLID